MRVRMLVGISGGRGDGTPWPPMGGEIDVSDDEGVQLCRGRLAVPVAVPPPAETPEDTLKTAEEPRAAPAGRPARTRAAKPPQG